MNIDDRFKKEYEKMKEVIPSKKKSVINVIRDNYIFFENELFPIWKEAKYSCFQKLHEIFKDEGYTNSREYIERAYIKVRKEKSSVVKVEQPKVISPQGREMPMAKKVVAPPQVASGGHQRVDQSYTNGIEVTSRKDGLMPWLVYFIHPLDSKEVDQIQKDKKEVTEWTSVEESLWYVLSRLGHNNMKRLGLSKGNPNSYSPLQKVFNELHGYRIRNKMPFELYSEKEIEEIDKLLGLDN